MMKKAHTKTMNIQSNKINQINENSIEDNKIYSKMYHKLLLELADGQLAYAYLSSIRLYRTPETQIPIVLSSEKESIKCLIQLKDRTIVSGYNNGLICLWTPDTYQSTFLTSSHEKAVLFLLQSKYFNHLISGSSDCTVKVWGLSSRQCLTTLNHHFDSISGLLELADKRLATGSFDNTIHIFNQPKYTLSAIISNSSKIYSMINVNNNHIAFGLNSKIQLWNISTMKCIRNLTNSHLKIVSILIKLRCGMLACCSDNIMIIWDLFSNACVEKYRIECEDDIYSMIELNDNRLAYILTGNEIGYITINKTNKIQKNNSNKTHKRIMINTISN